MNCEGFCTVAQAVCNGTNQQFADMDVCMSACASIMDGTGYNTGVMSGNSLACRLYYLNLAAADPASAAMHCQQIVPGSTVCR
jgi:hypothetical protein